MKIIKVETIQIETPRFYGHISGHVLVKVHVDDGPVGWGEASDNRTEDLGAIAKQYNDLLVGKDAGNITEINELLSAQAFHSTVSDRHLVSAIGVGTRRLIKMNLKPRRRRRILRSARWGPTAAW